MVALLLDNGAHLYQTILSDAGRGQGIREMTALQFALRFRDNDKIAEILREREHLMVMSNVKFQF